VCSLIAVKEPQFYGNIARLKMAGAGHVLRGSSDNSTQLVLKGKVNAVRTQERLRSSWIGSGVM